MNLRKLLRKKITSYFYDWELITQISRSAVLESQRQTYSDLSNRIPLDDLIAGLEKIRNERPDAKYVAVAELIRIQSDLINS